MSSPWKNRQKIPDPQVRDAADQFDDARRLLNKQPPGSGVLLPLLNNAIVALELYLLCLSAVKIHTPASDFPRSSIVTAEAKRRGHGLVSHLKSIRGDARKLLEQEYKTTPTGGTLEEALRPYEGLFAASRFAFEKGKKLDKYPLSPLMDLCSFFRDFVWRIEPSERIEWPRPSDPEESVVVLGSSRGLGMYPW